MSHSNIPDFVRQNVDLAAYNTLALPAQAAFFAEITQIEQLWQLGDCRYAARQMILGGGSNLVLSGDFDGLLLHIKILGKRLLAEDADAWYVQAGAGENWHEFVNWTLAQGFAGLENLVLIPGTVGAAPIQNIGAYGLELGERVHAVQAIDLMNPQKTQGKFQYFDRAACHFAYRDSVFKKENAHQMGGLAIVSVTFRLPKKWQPVLRYGELVSALEERQMSGNVSPTQLAAVVSSLRQRKLPDPKKLPNAGSFFHNPIVDHKTLRHLLQQQPNLPHYPHSDGRAKLAAAWLIEQSGWRGKSLGRVGMYEKQALVLVNHGGASGADVLALMHAVQQDVRAMFGVDLTPEPVFL